MITDRRNQHSFVVTERDSAGRDLPTTWLEVPRFSVSVVISPSAESVKVVAPRTISQRVTQLCCHSTIWWGVLRYSALAEREEFPPNIVAAAVDVMCLLAPAKSDS